MTQEQVVTLAQIYNSLLCVETRGESTRIMSKCLDALENIIIEIQNERKEKINNGE